jgi:Bacterial regulatory proteins, gntR family
LVIECSCLHDQPGTIEGVRTSSAVRTHALWAAGAIFDQDHSRSELMDQGNPEHRLYMLVAASLRDEIRTGLMAPGAKVPSITELCEKHCVSRQTSGKAMRVLASESLIYREPGLGWFVAVPR